MLLFPLGGVIFGTQIRFFFVFHLANGSRADPSMFQPYVRGHLLVADFVFRHEKTGAPPQI
jgi:hypothetical protein